MKKTGLFCGQSQEKVGHSLATTAFGRHLTAFGRRDFLNDVNFKIDIFVVDHFFTIKITKSKLL